MTHVNSASTESMGLPLFDTTDEEQRKLPDWMKQEEKEVERVCVAYQNAANILG